jgi:ribonuclease P protein component
VNRVRLSRDFARARAEGRRSASRCFAVETVRTTGATRLGLVVSRKVGGAVVRNRVKRRVREWFRRSRGQLPAHADWIVIARPGAAELSARETWSELDRLAQRGAR